MRSVIFSLLAVVLLSSVVFAGPLATDSNAYNDGVNPQWHGSTAFSNTESGLEGYVDWAVYAPGEFSYSGYTPTAGEAVYAFQIFNTGTQHISSFTLGLENIADNAGSVSGLSGLTPASIYLDLTPGEGGVTWEFEGINPSENSEGLAFCSANTPMDFIGVTVNGGSVALVIPVPTPSSDAIPEPLTLGLLATGGLALLRRRQ
ncbi:MAG: PEP-CTERM sorting domain-containing protein [Phycisphaerae bacterium]|jgi:hypothetical protein